MIKGDRNVKYNTSIANVNVAIALTTFHKGISHLYSLPDSTKLLCILSSDIQAYSLVHNVASLVALYPLISIENRQLTIVINRMAEFSMQLQRKRVGNLHMN